MKKEIKNECYSAEKCKRGPFGIFYNPFCCKISKQIKGAPFGTFQKSLIVPKKIQVKNTKIAKGESLARFRGSGRQFCFSFWTSF